MEVRSRIAAETASVVPFHCIICFEEFNLKDRLPVVLPCGHTFVCAPCSKRLKRCMECREPLFYTIPKKPHSPMLGPRGRYSHPTHHSAAPLTPPQHPSTPPHPSTVTQVPFPIPKNLVLISMMEAAASAQRQVPSNEVALADDSLNQNDGDEFDLKRILTGVVTLSGSCGTFVVKAPDGLSILPSLPDIQDTIVSAEDTTLSISQTKESSFEILEPLRIQQGQTVQVVQCENGYAKLARGVGFVKAKPNELVKVGAPLERSCQLEGQLETLAAQSDNLESELNRTKELSYLLEEEVQRLKTIPPNHPVISPIAADESSKENKETDLLATPTGVMGLHEMPTDADPLIFPFPHEGLCLPDSALPVYRRSTSNEALHEVGFGCDAFLGQSAQQLFGMELMPSNANTTSMLQSASHDIEQRRYSADDHPTYVPNLAASSFDTVDFRTGMSCHRGLQTNVRHSPTPRGRGLHHRYMMSEHRGIAGRTTAARTVPTLMRTGHNATP